LDPDYKLIIKTWWPLALSWLFMAFELPTVISFVSRLPDPEHNLAAFGGVVFPVSLFIEAPIMMFLPASTALCSTALRFRAVYRYMMIISFALTVLHITILFPPFFDFITKNLLATPEVLIPYVHTSLMIMIPWTWGIAYRRFFQGLLIRNGRSGVIGAGTLVRFTATVSIAAVSCYLDIFSGAVIAAMSIIGGVLSETFYVRMRASSTIKAIEDRSVPGDHTITFAEFLHFYVPLALSTVILLFMQPIGSAGMNRMPLAVASLALWPAMNGVMWIFRSLATAMTEIVIALYHDEESGQKLWNFTLCASILGSAGLFILSCPAITRIVFGSIFGFSSELVELATSAVLFTVPMSLLGGTLNWYNGYFTHKRKTKVITIGVAFYLLVAAAVLFLCVVRQPFPGVICALMAISCGLIAQLLWYIRNYK
jgi:hypothetical protein